jgi:phosphotransferase system  glucose/maltose/N-acetylglucosamine-specific IIC component
MMPFGKKGGWLAGALFGMASIAIFDAITGKLGVWTLVTGAMFGLMGAAAGLYLKSRKNSVWQYVGFSVVATLVYDFITGPIMSSMLFKLPFMVALVGQIPFTIWHLGGNIALAGLLSPALYRWVVNNRQLEWTRLIQRFGAKASA